MDRTRILLVDDENIMLAALERAFLADGFATLIARSGAEAMDTIKREKINAAVVDLLMPDIDGSELIEWISHTSPNTEIVAMSALMDTSTQILLKKYGVKNFLTKPLEDVMQVPKIVRRALLYATDSSGKAQS